MTRRRRKQKGEEKEATAMADRACAAATTTTVAVALLAAAILGNLINHQNHFNHARGTHAHYCNQLDLVFPLKIKIIEKKLNRLLLDLCPSID